MTVFINPAMPFCRAPETRGRGAAGDQLRRQRHIGQPCPAGRSRSGGELDPALQLGSANAMPNEDEQGPGLPVWPYRLSLAHVKHEAQRVRRFVGSLRRRVGPS
jgi:hypothetical protein